MVCVALVGKATTMIDTPLRQFKERTLSPIAKQISCCVSPLTLTLLGGGAGIAAAVTAGLGLYGIGLALWALNRILDGLDGTLARVKKTQSDLGGYLDIMIDFVVYAAIPLGLALSMPQDNVWLALAFMLATFYINAGSFLYLSALLERRQHGAKQRGELTSITMPVGLIEGAETVIAYGLFYLFPHWLAPLMAIFGLLVSISAVQRVVWAVRHLGES